MAEFKQVFYKFIPSKDEEEACKDSNTPWVVSSLSDDQKPLMSTKKTFFYKFLPSKDEEEACKFSNTPWVVTRELLEIRDIYPAPKINLENPWQIKKKITHEEVFQGMVVVPFFETFEYILRYWKLDMAKRLVNGYVVCVGVWNLTQENDPQIYQDASVCFRKLPNDDYSLSIMGLFNDRGLGVGDEIGLYWDPRSSSFMFKLLSKVSDSRIRPKKLIYHSLIGTVKLKDADSFVTN